MVILMFALLSCKSLQPVAKARLIDDRTFELLQISTDKTYGYSPKNAVNVGGVSNNEGPVNERRFLNALAGPKGERVTYDRSGSCCAVKSKNGFMGKALLDHYRVTWDGSRDTVSIYINMYDRGALLAPKGFSIKEFKRP